jgi:tetratricopeptide (TPR) repeat protein
MKESYLKYIFFISSGVLLFLMLLTSLDAGITCDEVLHYKQSVSVCDFFASHGKDRSALNTPVTNLKYYGQSFDNIVTILTRWFHIDNIYLFRHIMSSVAGWATILLTGLFAVWLAGYRTGILVIVLFAVSPAFLGHSQNNLKDIPFALGYISSIYYTLRFISEENKSSIRDIILLTVSIAFALSIRAGGLLLICYLFLFAFLHRLVQFLNGKKPDSGTILIKLLWTGGITVASWLAAILLWPYALQAPVRNVLASYRVMAHFPDTFRQIFEGKVEWSDFMPWYYLIKSMAITIPVIVLIGFCLFFVFLRNMIRSDKALLYFLILFSVFFPVVFVLYEKSNLYSSWRQFLFIYPAIIIVAATGLNLLFEYLVKMKYSRPVLILLIILLSINPLKFMISNHRYSYLYYNQLVGGLKGAYGNYETDYYYVSQTEASRWLLNYLKEKGDTVPVKIKATYSVSWLFRNHPDMETSYFRYEERSMSDWDFAIVANRYIPPFQLKNQIWPPSNAIHVVYADKVPICAVLERKSRDDWRGYVALNEGRTGEAIKYFEKALRFDDSDEMIFYNFATALYREGYFQKADSVLKRGLELNPRFELILMYLGNISRSQNKTDEAISYYRKVIEADIKYFEAYVALAELTGKRNLQEARDLLRRCLGINPGYKPAVVALADTYRISDPDIAEKYDELAKTMK